MDLQNSPVEHFREKCNPRLSGSNFPSDLRREWSSGNLSLYFPFGDTCPMTLANHLVSFVQFSCDNIFNFAKSSVPVA